MKKLLLLLNIVSMAIRYAYFIIHNGRNRVIALLNELSLKWIFHTN